MGADCAAVECPCAAGPTAFSGICESGEGGTAYCLPIAEVCDRADCPLGSSSATGTGASSGVGGAPSSTSASTGATGAVGGSGAGSSSGSGTRMHPECFAYGDGQCVCGFNGRCAPGQYEEIVDFCNTFFDTEYMQCSIGCVTAGGTCEEKAACDNACDT
jgi:hypothetical protein